MAAKSSSRIDYPPMIVGVGRDFAVDLAREAGKIIRRDFKLGMEKMLKSDNSIVTPTDIKVNEMVVREVRDRFPTHDVVAEEGSYKVNKARSTYRWVCDPIDGTVVYSHGVPTSVFSLALTKNGRPLVGVVYDPFLDRMFVAPTPRGTDLNGEQVRVSRNDRLKGSIIGLSYWNGAQVGLSKLHERLVDSGAKVLMLGSITYMGAMVAAGEFTASVHPARAAYDSTALKIIVEEAGGRVTDLFGKDPRRWDERLKGSIMSNGLLHDKLVRLMRE
ncbi:MAG: hypothetical protein KGH94_02545 [Candidatus Micrarchaeota archaeon]|nr:hypothetical protein [Candidatus Micrarchaeota archaeon]